MKQDKHRLNVVLMLIAFALLAGRATAADKYWNPTSGNGWNTGANWSPSGVPGGSDVAIFDGGTSSGDCLIDVNANAVGVLITNAYAGTITQGAGKTVTVGASNYVQNAGTFAGGDTNIVVGGLFTLAGGTFTSTSGKLTLGPNNNDTFSVSGGTFNPNNGTVRVDLTAGAHIRSFPYSVSLYDLELINNHNTQVGAISIGTGQTVTVNRNFSELQSNGPIGIGGTGTLAVKGNITMNNTVSKPFGGAQGGLLLINGTGDQTISANGNRPFPRIEINKTGGTLYLGSSTIETVQEGFVYTAGTVDVGTSTFVFDVYGTSPTFAGNFTFYNLTIANAHYFAAGMTITGTPSWIVKNTLSMGGANTGSIGLGGLTIQAQGDVTTQTSSGLGGTTFALTFTGSGPQTFTDNITGLNGIVKIDKSGGAVTLGANCSLIAAGQQLVWTNGALNLSSNTLTVAGAVTIYSGATTLGVTVADTNRAGRLTCSNTVSGLANVGLEVSVTAPKEQWPQIPAQTYTILSNTNVLAAPFEAVTWVGNWRGTVDYSANGGKNVTLSNVRSVAGGSVLMVQ